MPALIVFVSGTILTILLGAAAISPAVDTFTGPITSFTTPGSAVVDLDAGDQRVIYLQTAGAVGSTGDAGAISAGDLNCRVTNTQTETAAAVKPAGNLTLGRGSDEYVARLRFTADTAGRHRVRCVVAGDPARQVPLAVGPKVQLARLLGAGFGAIAAFVLTLLLSLGIVVLVAVLRWRNRSKQRDAGTGPGRPPAPPPPIAGLGG